MKTYEDVLTFWYEEAGPDKWFNGGADFDKEIWNTFEEEIVAAKAGELHEWRATIHGRLAEIIILDQFSRNVFRGDVRSFSSDDMALVLAQEALKSEDFGILKIEEKQFLFMPFMHSESLAIHESLAVPLFADTKGLEESYKFELAHKEQIDRFGRYPFRNEVLGRESTEDELAFMSENENF